ncbi:MAG: hypothetical protein AB8H79_24445 [Myxococcota bacterium]
MHDTRWQHLLDELARDYFVAAFRPELPVAERLRAAQACRVHMDRFAAGGVAAVRYLSDEAVGIDSQRRNSAARALCAVGDDASVRQFARLYLDTERQWLSPSHLVRAGRRVRLDPALKDVIAEASPRLQPAWVRALLAHEDPESRALLQRLVVGPDRVLAEVAVEAAAQWQRSEVLWGVLQRVDGTDDPPPGLVPAGLMAALTLAARGQSRAIGWIEERTLDTNPQIGALAHVYLAMLGWPSCLAELMFLLDESEGRALGYALEAAEVHAASVLVAPLCNLVRRTATHSGSGLDDNPADHAIRVLEGITGRSVPAALCSYDRFGNLDESTRLRAALVHSTAGSSLGAAGRFRRGQPIATQNWVMDLVSPSARKVRAASIQLWARTGRDLGFDCRDDLIANLDAVLAWRKFGEEVDVHTPVPFVYANQRLASPVF